MIRDAVLDVLSRAPWKLGAPQLRRILSLIAGDGAVVLGGPEKQSPSTGAAELMWQALHAEERPAPGEDSVLAELATVVETKELEKVKQLRSKTDALALATNPGPMAPRRHQVVEGACGMQL